MLTGKVYIKFTCLCSVYSIFFKIYSENGGMLWSTLMGAGSGGGGGGGSGCNFP